MSRSINPDHIKNYFRQKLETYGATPRGADWNSQQSQSTRFEQLAKIIHAGEQFSINDYGCGYGALYDYLVNQGYECRYFGYDLLEPMVQQARENHKDDTACRFTSNESDLPAADYTLASGIFNIRFDYSHSEWTDYVLKILDRMDQLSRRGFAFNMLTKYSDEEYMRPHLYYADPCYLFDHCKTHYSRNIALLHDYELYDFTILVRKS
jgi:SAM-dependent methyltransferase